MFEVQTFVSRGPNVNFNFFLGPETFKFGSPKGRTTLSPIC